MNTQSSIANFTKYPVYIKPSSFFVINKFCEIFLKLLFLFFLYLFITLYTLTHSTIYSTNDSKYALATLRPLKTVLKMAYISFVGFLSALKVLDMLGFRLPQPSKNATLSENLHP